MGLIDDRACVRKTRELLQNSTLISIPIRRLNNSAWDTGR
jgi:hypothetical protein